MGQIIDFKINEDNINKFAFYNINKEDVIVRKILGTVDLSKCNSYNDLEKFKFKKIEKNLSNLIPDSKYKDRIISIIELVKNYTDKDFLVLKDSNVIGYINNNDYLFVSIKDKSVEYAVENDSYSSYGKLRFFKDKYIIRYNNICKSLIFDIINKTKKLSVNNSTDIMIYDSNNINLSKKRIIFTNNYSMIYDKDNEFSVPDKFNNVTTDKYIRVGNNVLRNIKIEYLNKKYVVESENFVIDEDTINTDEYFIGYNYKVNSKNIPDDIYYQKIDYEDYIKEKVKRK